MWKVRPISNTLSTNHLGLLQPVEALSSTEIFWKAARRAAVQNISGF
ncbi:MAG: hypothetical protein ACK5Y3_13525 [Pseudanabaena sp.]